MNMEDNSKVDETQFSFQDDIHFLNNLPQNLTDEQIQQILLARQFSFMLQQSANQPTTVSSVSFKGVKNTKQSVLQNIFNPVFEAKDLQSTLTQLTDACGKLEALNIVKSVEINLKPAAGQTSKNALGIELEVKEVPKFTVKTGTEFGEGESSLDTSLTVKNIFGGGERFEGSAKFGTLTRHNFQLNYLNPLDLHRPDRLLHLFAFDSTTDFQLNAAHDLISRGIGASFKGNSSLGNHELTLASTWRTVTRMGFQSPPEIRKEAGDSILTCIKHSHTLGTLDNPVLPNQGYRFKLHQELSGFNSTSRHVKTKLDALLAKRLTNSISVNMNAQAGLLMPLDSKPTLLPDRFHLGGPTSVRGFRTWGLGEHDRGSSLGGDFYWSLGLSIFGRVPVINSDHLKWHGFFNMGNLAKFHQDAGYFSQVKQHVSNASFYANHTSSAGVGLVYQLQNVRLEANYTLPVSVHARDQIRKGFQLGLGIEFL